MRIWRVGTKRILGVVDGGWHDLDDRDDFPSELRRLIPDDPFDTNVYGNYTVCPLTRERPGWMQLVCVAGATNLVSRPR